MKSADSVETLKTCQGVFLNPVFLVNIWQSKPHIHSSSSSCFGQTSFPRMVRPIEYSPICPKSEEVAVFAAHEVLGAVDYNGALIVCDLWWILDEHLWLRPIHLLNINIIVITITNYNNTLLNLKNRVPSSTSLLAWLKRKAHVQLASSLR